MWFSYYMYVIMFTMLLWIYLFWGVGGSRSHTRSALMDTPYQTRNHTQFWGSNWPGSMQRKHIKPNINALALSFLKDLSMFSPSMFTEEEKQKIQFCYYWGPLEFQLSTQVESKRLGHQTNIFGKTYFRLHV